MYRRGNYQTYAQIGVEDRVQESEPVALIVLLFEKVATLLRRTTMLPITEVEQLPLEEKLKVLEDFNLSISSALQILIALRELIDVENGGSLAIQLKDTYSSISKALWQASKDKDIGALEKLLAAIEELKGAWVTVSSQPANLEL
jgi:flagellar biosynthetic protein FliS